jgi:hypothetical protein
MASCYPPEQSPRHRSFISMGFGLRHAPADRCGRAALKVGRRRPPVSIQNKFRPAPGDPAIGLVVG